MVAVAGLRAPASSSLPESCAAPCSCDLEIPWSVVIFSTARLTMETRGKRQLSVSDTCIEFMIASS